jgi:hypothetical protein
MKIVDLLLKIEEATGISMTAEYDDNGVIHLTTDLMEGKDRELIIYCAACLNEAFSINKQAAWVHDCEKGNTKTSESTVNEGNTKTPSDSGVAR